MDRIGYVRMPGTTEYSRDSRRPDNILSMTLRTAAPVPVARSVAGFSYAIRNIVAEAQKVEAEGRRVRYLNIGDPILGGFRTPPELIAAVIQAARGKGVPVLVDPKGTDYTRYRGATIITPNRRETEEALGRKLSGLHELPEAAQQLMEIAALSSVVITLGADGIFYLTRGGESGRVPTVARAVFDVTGAGDTVIAMLALGIASGVGLEAAVHLAYQ